MKRFLPALVCSLAVVALSRHWHPSVDFAYVGPGAGFAFLGSFLTLVIAFCASVVSLLIWPFRVLWLLVRRRGHFGAVRVKRAIFLGLDGLDPNLAERWMEEGKLPNLARLRAEGCYTRLRTTFPALSPVAWSTFATGVNPAKHNIFDFLNRDLRTYAPELSSARVRIEERVWRIGRWRIPMSRASVELRRKSEPFWKILGRNAIPSTILRVPVTFPPDRFEGRMLSAMSTPDLRGTQGSFTWFSTRADHTCVEGGLRLPLTRRGDCYEGCLPGPEKTRIAFTLSRENLLAIAGQRFVLKVGEYTPWVRLRFGRARGIVRFLLTKMAPPLELYVTPIEIDPEHPALPISHPGYYATYLAKLLGTYATLGMAEDTWALNEGAIDEDAFLAQARLIQEERERMYFSALEHMRSGVVACVFDTTDRVQHMFFRHLGQESRYARVIEELYRDMDRVVGRTLAFADADTAVFVLSDHGFCAFRRGVNLNTWLRQNGYLALKDGAEESGEYLSGIDWARTRAYAFGLGGLYLNLEGREAHGIVRQSEAAALKAELIERLTGLCDDETSEIGIQNVYDAEKIYRGPYRDAAPDLVPGYAPGYRAAWSAAVGRVTRTVFETNDKAWSGDHCVDPAVVPGVLFSNRKLKVANPGIEDLAPTVLDLFGIAAPKWMEGQTLCAE
ncbi:MAG TPA: alkaline phosphatase family protein [Bryobacteraceae bacterium]|jgi:predicted AlkP superfamily phosphohydrolase/phosphomutase|nr:alkaline phosphatase family protein [Bryobacteraceae bacterium]